MDVYAILKVVGVIATIVFGIVKVIQNSKYRNRTKITFIKNESIALFQTIVKNFGDLEISYQGKKIDENLIFLKGTFLNNGNVDIDKSLIHKPLEIELPENLEWKEFKIINQSEDVDIKVSQNAKKMILEWGLFKRDEFFTFDCLVEFKSLTNKESITTSSLIKKIKFNQRIAGLKSIENEDTLVKPAHNLVFIIPTFFFLVSIGCSAIIYDILFNDHHRTQVFKSINYNNKQYFLKIIEQASNQKIDYFDSKGNEVGKLSLDELKTIDETGSLRIVHNLPDYFSVAVFAFIATFGLLMGYKFIERELRIRNLYKKVKAAPYP